MLEEGGKDGENETVERLNLFKNAVSLHVFYTFVGFKVGTRGQGYEDAVDGSILWLARLDDQIATVATCLLERETQGLHLQVLYSCRYLLENG